MTMLDPKGLEAACAATVLGEDEYGKPVRLDPREAETAISAYLSTVTPAEVGGLVEALAAWDKYDPLISDEKVMRQANAVIEASRSLLTALTAERAAHAETRRERDGAMKALREVRREISKTHKNAVKHENCERQYCPICEGGLFQCADCGAAEIETEQRVCTGSETRLAEALKALDALLELNDNHSPFGGELYQDRVDSAWDAARRVREGDRE